MRRPLPGAWRAQRSERAPIGRARAAAVVVAETTEPRPTVPEGAVPRVCARAGVCRARVRCERTAFNRKDEPRARQTRHVDAETRAPRAHAV